MSLSEHEIKEENHQELFAKTRQAFLFPVNDQGKPRTYLCGNSLGLQPRLAQDLIQQELQRWATLGIDGYFEGETAWVRYADRCKSELARLTGSGEDEVVLMNSLTTNLHLLMASFFQPRSNKRKILIEQQAFPTDHYAMASQLQWHGLSPAEDLIVVQPDQPGGVFSLAHLQQVIEQHADELALILLPAVQYVSGQWLPMEEITRLAHRHGITIGWDCAHAAGNVPLKLHDWQADFAVGCTYKYLNGGPGAPGWAFVHRAHHGRKVPRLTGWWGNRPQSRFEMAPDFEPADGVNAWQLSNIPVLAAAAVLAGLSAFSEVPISALREQSLRLHADLRGILAQHDQLVMLTPESDQAHGCQLAFGHGGGRDATRELFEHLLADDIIGDWREPGIIRLSPVPLYNNQEDLHQVAGSLGRFFQR